MTQPHLLYNIGGAVFCSYTFNQKTYTCYKWIDIATRKPQNSRIIIV